MDAQQFLAEFGHIANAPGGVARMRELVLQLAISGRLVERISTDSPVDDSLDQAAMQRAAYESELELRPTRLHSPLNTSPFAIPAHWRWIRLEQLALYIQRGKGPKYAEGGAVSVVSQKCIQWAGFDISQARKIADESVDAYGQERFLCPGDLLWNSTGTGTAGRVAIFQGQPGKRAVADSHVTVMRLANSQPKYLWCVIASPWVQVRIHPTHPESLVTGTTQQVELATSTARALAVPCPPVEEQARIVAKVDELMALCDRLEKQQQDRRKLQNALRESTLQALASSKSPHELLESWQRLQANFGLLFSDPRDVDVLRGLVLDMGVKGYLVHLTGSGDTADDFLRSLDKRKQEIARHRKLRLQRQLPQLSEDEVPYACPEGWRWVRLGGIAELINGDRGKNYPNKDEYVSEGVPWINTGHIEPDGTLTVHHMNFITREKFEALNSGKIEPNDLVYCLRGATFGKTAFVSPYTEGAIASSLMIIRPLDARTARYVYYYLISPFGRSQIFRYDNGTAQPNLSANSVGLFPFPLPPLDVQERIVKRIEDLLVACDVLEEQKRSSRRVAELISAAVVSALTGIAIEQDKVIAVKAPQTELIAPLRLGTLPDVNDQAPLATLLSRNHGEMSASDLWQRFGGEIDAFYAQLKTEVLHGWITEPSVAKVRGKPTETTGA